MSGFDSHEIPDWVKDQFNERTALPNGPLEHLPVPVEGQIVGAQSCMPSDGRPERWTTSIVCAEPFDDCMRFYEEFLPLAGYELVAIGSLQAKRSWFSRYSRSVTGLIIFRVAQYVARMTVDPNAGEDTQVEVEMAHCQHESVRDLVDRDSLRKRADVNWRLRP